MAEHFFSDEEIHQTSGTAPRMPSGIPLATCLACGEEHRAFYAAQAHECRVALAEKRQYGDWLRFFQRLGYGVLQEPGDKKFPFDKLITGRTALTFHLQSDLHLGPTTVLDSQYYETDEWETAGLDRGGMLKRVEDPTDRNKAFLDRLHGQGLHVGLVNPDVEEAKTNYREAHKDD